MAEIKPVPTKPASPYAGVMLVCLAVGALIGLGVLPTSCGKLLPLGLGKHYEQFCDDCGGYGKVSRACLACAGHGYYGGTRCVTCGGTGKVEQVCAFCAGSGKKPVTNSLFPGRR